MKRSPVQTQPSVLYAPHWCATHPSMTRRNLEVIRVVGLIACLLSLTFVGGCSCWKDPLSGNGKNDSSDTKKPETLEEMEARRKELLDQKEKAPDFETARLTVLPADDSPASDKVKPGHWFNAVQTMKANSFDFPKGELEAQCVNRKASPIRLTNTEFHLNSTRPVNLPKGQTKHFDILLHASKPKGGPINFMTRLRPRGGSREVDWASAVTSTMKKFQNHFVVLSDRPDNYQFVKTLRSVKPIRSDDELFNVEFDYFVKLPKGTRRIDVPSHALAWTSTAYVLWDDFDPEIMSAEQQQAMIDWLHWGGQLIINGPKTLDKLQISQFGDLLPAKTGTVASVTSDQVNALNENWSFTDVEGASTLSLPEKEDDRPLALDLELTEGSQFVPNTGQLVAERFVGRGRVVTTAFNIPHPFFTKWDSFDSFFNSCLLSRPSRRFDQGRNGITERWHKVSAAINRDDPRLTSKVRYFSRDAVSSSNRLRSTQPRGATRLANSAPAVPVTEDELARDLRARRVASSAMPQVASARPDVRVRLRGIEVIQPNVDHSVNVEFVNTGNAVITDGSIVVRFDDEIELVSASAGFRWDINDSELRWEIQPMPPGSGGSAEIRYRVPEGLSKNAIQFDVAFDSDQVKTKDDLQVDVGTEEAKHQLARVSEQAFGVYGFSTNDLTGVAGWDDQSNISQHARRALEFAAGITVPAKSFVAKVIGVYLLVLVPLNWVIFRLMGRVEWAWAAIPVIAIGGAIGVVKSAQLDIGFVRSRTEIAVVEMQPGYDRGHVTRYTGFYTSLSSDYEIRGEDGSTLIQPFALSGGVNERDPTRGATLHQDDGIRLKGFDVTSNSTGMIHTEQMLGMGGAISMKLDANRMVVSNESDHDLKGSAVVRRTEDKQVEVAWIGDLAKKSRFTELQFEPLETANLAFPEWEGNTSTSSSTLEGDLNIRLVMEVATDPQRLGVNESVLVGWSDQLLGGIEAKPKATQVNSRTLFVVQLQHADRPVPQRDRDCFAVMDRFFRDTEQDDLIFR